MRDIARAFIAVTAGSTSFILIVIGYIMTSVIAGLILQMILGALFAQDPDSTCFLFLSCLLCLIGAIFLLALVPDPDDTGVAFRQTVFKFVRIAAVALGVSAFAVGVITWKREEWLVWIFRHLHVPPRHVYSFFDNIFSFVFCGSLMPAFFFFWLGDKRDRFVKHGLPLRAPSAKREDQGLLVGTYDRKVFPVEIRGFSVSKNAPVYLPWSRLARGISILGDQGSGKTRLLFTMVESIRRRYPMTPILIHDPKGEWLRTSFYAGRDLIFGPYEKRTCRWNLFHDIRENPQLLSTVVSTAVHQHHSGATESRYWVDGAIHLIKETLELSTDVMDFRERLVQWRQQRLEDRTALSIFSSARPAIKDLVTLELVQGEEKTLKDFLGHPGSIFLLNSPAQAEEQNGPFAVFLATFMLYCLSLPDLSDPETDPPRAVFVLDEALSFYLPPEVERQMSAMARSKGLILIMAAQWLPNEDRKLLTRPEFMFGMKVKDLATSKILADLGGDVIFEERSKSDTTGAHSSTTAAYHERHRKTIPAEWFRVLPPRCFILFHPEGIASGVTLLSAAAQRDNIEPFIFQRRPDVSEYMAAL